MKYKKAISGVVATAGVMAAIIFAPHHVGPAALYSDSKLSPGLAATQSVDELTNYTACGTYSQCHRQTSEALKKQIRDEYPNIKCPVPSDCEVDHIVPLALGGADDAKNLWLEPLHNEWNGKDFGYKQKDLLESILVLDMKSGKITPSDAQREIMTDWVSAYLKRFGKTPTFGSADLYKDTDGENTTN